MDGSASQAARTRRARNAVLSTASGTIARAVTAFVGLFSVPIALSYLGDEGYGTWLTLSSIISFLSFSDLGIGDSVVTSLSASHGRKDSEFSSKLVSTAFYLLLLLALIIIGAAIVVDQTFSWRAIINAAPSVSDSSLRLAAIGLSVFFAVNLVNSLGLKVNISAQEGYINNGWQILGSFFVLSGLLLLPNSSAAGSLPLIVLIVAGPPVLVTSLNAATSLWFRDRGISVRASFVDREVARSVLKTGGWFTLTYFLYEGAMSIGSLSLAHLHGPASVKDLAVPMKMFALVNMAIAVIIHPLWPAFAEARANNDSTWVVRTFRRAIFASSGISISLSAAVAASSSFLLSIWVGDMVTVTSSQSLALAIWSSAFSIGNSLGIFLYSMNLVRPVALTRLVHLIILVPLCLIMTRISGASGAAWSLAISEIAFRFVPLLVVSIRKVRLLRFEAIPLRDISPLQS